MKLGIFDSGIGGLSVANSIYNKYPNVDIHYVSDSKYLPYGNQDPNIIKERVKKIVSFLIDAKCDYIICACNTAFAVAEDELNEFSKEHNILNVTENFLRKFHSRLPEKSALIATKNTIETRAYYRLLEEFNSDIDLLAVKDEKLVPLIEGEAPIEEIKKVVNELLYKIGDDREAIVLGCTHYNDIAPVFQALKPGLQIFTSQMVFDDCFDHAKSGEGKLSFFDTGESSLLKKKVWDLYKAIPKSLELVLQD